MPQPVSDRIMTMRLPLSKDNFATIISVYAPIMTNPDENKDTFYNHLASGIPRTDRIGREIDKWPWSRTNIGLGNATPMASFYWLCSEFELVVTNTMFKQKDERTTTWMHPRSRNWHMIDVIITTCPD